MPDMSAPPVAELPSRRTLLRSTILAAAVALVLLVTVVLPAEYGVDPTRIGRLLGLKEMGEIKLRLAREAAVADSLEVAAVSGVPAANAPAAEQPASGATDTQHVTEVVLRPGEGKEIKLVMRKDARVTYSWSIDRDVVNYDMHADGPAISYHGYAKGSARQRDEGVLVAAFDGMHGWFWRNRGEAVITITLRTSGNYQELKRL